MGTFDHRYSSCETCYGAGKRLGREDECESCSGTGIELTPLGRELMEFLKRYFTLAPQKDQR